MQVFFIAIDKTKYLKTRIQLALKAFIIHLIISVVVSCFLAYIMFCIWFPGYLKNISGGLELFYLIIGINFLCGPFLTMAVFNPAKPRSELIFDITLVATIHLAALIYGIYIIINSRPLAIIHEVDRFRIITNNDIIETKNLPDWAKPWKLSTPRTRGTRFAIPGPEQLSSIDSSLQGIEPSQRPSWWQDYALSVPQVLQRARPLGELRAKHPNQSQLLNSAAIIAIADARAGEATDPSDLRWLPLMSRRATDWVVLLDPVTARIRGHVNLDGF